jgi:hypothetical protein
LYQNSRFCKNTKFNNGCHFCNTSWPGPGYTDTGCNPDWFGYTHPSNWIDGHRPGSNNCGLTTIPSGYNYCADEGGFCSFSGTADVIYGADNCYTSPRSFTDGTACNNDVFGDPVPGVQKRCYTNGSSLPPPSGNWNARYDQGSTLWWDPNANITPRCTETINGPELHKDWGSGAPCGGMNGDDWVGDFEATINFPAGEYVFHLEHDDGVKLWLNGQNIQDRGGSGSGPVCPARHLSGDNQLRVLLREEGGDARVHLTWSTDTSVCNPPPDPPALQSPSNGSTFDEGESITLCWSDTGDEYYGEIWGGPGGTLTFGWQGSTCRNIGSQWAGYTYSWHVRARNSAGTSDWSDTWTFTVKPAAPSNLSAQAPSCSQINLSWNDNSGNEEGYRIYRNRLVAQ